MNRIFMLGTRQVGKTTLVSTLAASFAGPTVRFDLEDPAVVIQALQAEPHECYFWRTHTGAELDLLVIRGMNRIGFEVKRTTAPSMTPSMRNALVDLKLTKLYVLHAGSATFPMSKQVLAVALQDMLNAIKPLR